MGKRLYPATDEPLTAEQRQLVESMYLWCWQESHKAAKRLRGRTTLNTAGDLADELFQSAIAEVSIGARRFDVNRGFTSCTYLAWYCKRGIQSHIRQLAPIGPSFSTYSGLIRPETPGSIGVTLTDDDGENHYIPARDDDDAESMSDDAAAIMDTLPPRDRAMVSMYAIDRLPCRLIAAQFGVTRGRVQQIVQQSLRRLREHPLVRDLAGVES